MKQQIQNLKFRIQKGQPRMEHGQNTDLETKLNRRKRSERRSEVGAARTERMPYHAKAGKGGKEMARKWEKAGKTAVFSRIEEWFPALPAFSQLFPPFPTSIFNKEAMKCGMQERWTDAGPEAGAPPKCQARCGKNLEQEPGGAWNRDGKWSAGVLELWRDRVARSGERGIMREN